MKTVILAMAIVLLTSMASAKDFPVDISFTPSVAYDSARWTRGEDPSPTGKIHGRWVGLDYAAQVKYTGWGKWQPTFEFNYRNEQMGFSAQRQRAHISPDMLNYLAGITYGNKFVTPYLLMGLTHTNFHLSLIESNGLCHGTDIEVQDDRFAIKIGAYKVWQVWKIKVGPEVAMMIYPNAPRINRCRHVEVNRVLPSAGIRIQW